MYRPPRLAEFLLSRLLPPATREYILGDLADDYSRSRERGVGALRSGVRYWRHALESVGPSARDRFVARRRARRLTARQHHRLGEQMYAFAQDIRFAVRTIIRNPVFGIVTVLTLAIGIGANAAIFSVVRGILLAPLPYNEPSDLVSIWVHWDEAGSARTTGGHNLSEPELFDLRGSEALQGAGAYTTRPVNVTGDGEAERVVGGYLTSDVFAMLGVDAAVGRPFTADEDRSSAPLVAVLAHGYWQQRFGGDPAAVGRDLVVNGLPRTIVGVMPPEFRLPTDYTVSTATRVWMPLRLVEDSLSGRGSHYLDVVGRLSPGRTVEQANADLARISQGLIDQGLYEPQSNFRMYTVPLTEHLLGDVRPVLLVLYGAVGFVLLIACANVANLMLARAESRRREVAVRTAMGAGRGVLLRQLLTESVVLSTIGGLFGVGLAVVGLRTLIALDPASVPRLSEVRLDGTVLGYTAIVSILTGFLFGVAPALRSGGLDVQGALKEGARTASAGRGRHRVQRALVGAQVGFAVLLVIAAGLTLRSFGNLLGIDAGFETEDVLTVQVAIPSTAYPESEQVAGFYTTLLDALRALPNVRSAGAARVLPLAQHIGDWSITIEGRVRRPGEDFDGDWQVVTPGYFETMRIPLLEGRVITADDRMDGQQVVVVNERMARHYWPDESALGKRFRMGPVTSPWIEIVGVVGDVRHNGISNEINPKFYRPHGQFGRTPGFVPTRMTLVLRADGDAAAMAGTVRAAVRSLDPNVPVSGVQTMDAVLAASVAQPRFTLTVLVVFGGVALLLAAVGVYGVIAYTISERTHELGLRRALGATGSNVVSMVVRQGMSMAGIGVVAGVIGAWWLTRFMTTILYDVGTRDATTFIAVPVILSIVALAASGLAARKAVRVAPIVALRGET